MSVSQMSYMSGICLHPLPCVNLNSSCRTPHASLTNILYAQLIQVFLHPFPPPSIVLQDLWNKTDNYENRKFSTTMGPIGIRN